MVRTIQIKNLDKAFMEIMNALTETSRREIGIAVQALPHKFELEAKARFTDVLRVRSGQLRRSIEALSRRSGSDSWEIGLRDDKNYAHVQHEGFHGRVNVKQHIRRGGISVRAHTREMNIRATKFLEDPIRRVMKRAKELILGKIKWKA